MLKALAVAPEQIWTGVPVYIVVEILVLGESDLIFSTSFLLFSFLIIFPLPSLFMSLTYLQRNQAHQESLREILHPRPCVPMDNRQRYSKAGFFYTFFKSVIFLLFSPSFPIHPSPPPSPKTKKRKKKKTHKNKRHQRPQPPPLTNSPHRNRTNRRLKNQLKFTKQNRRNRSHAIR